MTRRQSPVNIPASAPVHRDGLEFDYRPMPCAVTLDPYFTEVACAPGSGAVSDGIRYELVRFHVHCPSEHAFEGETAVGELHFVHLSGGGALAVVGVLLVIGSTSPGLEPLIAADAGAETPIIEPDRLLPSDRGHVRYEGSLTTPPFTEGVRWFVMQEALSIGPEQLAALEAVHNGNNRPLQPLAGRRFD